MNRPTSSSGFCVRRQADPLDVAPGGLRSAARASAPGASRAWSTATAWISSTMHHSVPPNSSCARPVSIRYSDSGVVIRMSGGWRSIAWRSRCGVSPVRTATFSVGADPAQRRAQVAVDVVGERLQRRDVDEADAAARRGRVGARPAGRCPTGTPRASCPSRSAREIRTCSPEAIAGHACACAGVGSREGSDEPVARAGAEGAKAAPATCQRSAAVGYGLRRSMNATASGRVPAEPRSGRDLAARLDGRLDRPEVVAEPLGEERSRSLTMTTRPQNAAGPGGARRLDELRIAAEPAEALAEAAGVADRLQWQPRGLERRGGAVEVRRQRSTTWSMPIAPLGCVALWAGAAGAGVARQPSMAVVRLAIAVDRQRDPAGRAERSRGRRRASTRRRRSTANPSAAQRSGGRDPETATARE